MAHPADDDETGLLVAFAQRARSAQQFEALLHELAILTWMAERGLPLESPLDLDALEQPLRQELDALREAIQEKTLGQVLRSLNAQLHLSPGTRETLRQGALARNYLFHHFFRDNLVAYLTAPGRARMLMVLKLLQRLLGPAEAEAQQLVVAHSRLVGQTDEGVRRVLAATLAALAALAEKELDGA